MDIWDLTAHQLDVIRTIGAVIGAIGGFFGGVGAIGAFLARYWAKQAARNTTSSDWKSGTLVETPVAETARHAALSGEAARQEVSDLSVWIKQSGRRRDPNVKTDQYRFPPPGESRYE